MSGKTLLNEKSHVYQILHDALARVHPDFKLVYVDSNLAGNPTYWSGSKLPNALPTIDAGINKLVTSRADLVLVSPFHTETVSTAGGITADLAGLRILNALDFLNLQGLVGNLRPTITFSSSTAATFLASAANLQIVGLEFACSIASQVRMLHLNASADGALIKNCLFRQVSTTTGLVMLDIADVADNVKIEGCEFYGNTAGNWDSAIKIGAAVDRLHIHDVLIRGDFDDAGIHNPTGNVATNLDLRRIAVRNAQSGQHAIELVSACTGFAEDILCVTDALATAFDAGSLEIGKNVNWQSTTGGDVGVSPVFVQPDSANNLVGADNNNNAASTSSVVANGDGSVLERLELLQQAAPAMALDRNAGNYLSVLADFTSATWNTVASHEIATVTGMVHLVIVPEVISTPTSAGSGATLVLGDETTTNSIIASTDAENLATGEVWFDATDTRTLAARSIFYKTDVVVAGGKDIGYTVGTEALTGGSIRFHMWWWPISSTGAVAAGAGGAL